ncbi:MAG: hypothetical protein RIQ53_1057 [Pseudomonadota bacterium]
MSRTEMSDLPVLMTLADAAALIPGARLVGDGRTPFVRVHSDTRSLAAGDLFVALRGERFDAHDFLPQAGAAGAVALLAERGVAEAGLPGLEVADSLAALQALAAGWRARFSDLPLIAVAGSNGKTTVTQMLASVLRAWVGEPAALATAGNYNNHIGVPLTLLRLRPQHRAAVVELGMNHPGEIAQLAAMAAPTVALVNNAQREHQEFMASVEAVARENGQVLAALPTTGTAVWPAEDADHAPLWRALAGERRAWRFALVDEAHALASAEAELCGCGVWQTGAASGWRLHLRSPAGRAELLLQAPGAHNLRNALCVTAAALAAGAPLQAVVDGLQAFRPVNGRSQLKALAWRGRDLTLVDDSYNANPDSVRAAIDLLAGLPGPQALLLGDMGEVGDQGPAFHAEVGAYARERGIATLWCAGTLAAEAARAYGPTAVHAADATALLAVCEKQADGLLDGSASLLVKGSRFMRMERLVQALQARAAAVAPASAEKA